MKKRILRFSIALLVIAVSLFALYQPAGAVGNMGITDKAELEKFMDSIIVEAMEKYKLPGTVFSVVKDGKVFLEKGYGYANVDKKIPADPESSLFRIGSISKLFTAAAVMQLKEQGRIDFDRDVNDYLKEFKIKSRYSKPVTMYNLLTHTGGFDDQWTGTAAQDYSDVLPLGEYLGKNMPEIIREPGTVTQYSNHGIALAGYIVEEISGIPFEEYIAQNITYPLRMNNTYPRITQGMVNNLALEYTYKSGSYKPMQLYDFNIYPAGSVCSTASDMAKFMIAHLNYGTSGETSILKKETAREMQSQHFTNSPGLPGMCYGFYEIMENNHRFIAHGGDTNGTHSFLLLDPAENMGLFLSTNGLQGNILTSQLIDKFIEHYYTGTERPVFSQPYEGTLGNGVKFEGQYRSVRYARNTLDKLILLMTPQASIKVDNNNLVLQSPHGSGRYVQVEPLLFQNMENGRFLSFRMDNSGDTAFMFNEIPTFAFEKIRWYESNNLHIILLGASILLSISWCIYCCISYLKSRKKRNGMQGRLARRLLTIISASNIISLVAAAITMLSMDSVSDIGYMLPLMVKIVLICQVAVAVLTGVLAVVVFIVWKKGYWRVKGRICFTLVAFSNILFTTIMYYYNMIGIRY